MAVLATLAMFFTANYVTWAKNTADAKTLEVLNDALTRYKCQGGDVNALTLGAPIGNIISSLKTPVDWAGMQHQFLQSGVTFQGKSLDAVGTRTNYRFYRYNTYAGETPAAGTATSTYPYGSGVGYIANNSASSCNITISTNTGFLAYLPAGLNTPAVVAQGSQTIPACTSFTFWPCTNGNSTLSGNITGVSFNTNSTITSLDASALTGITTITAFGCTALTSIKANNCGNLTSLQAYSNSSLSTINATGDTALTSLRFYGTALSASTSNLNALWSILPTVTGTHNIYIGGSGYASSNELVATAKGWTVQHAW